MLLLTWKRKEIINKNKKNCIIIFEWPFQIQDFKFQLYTSLIINCFPHY